MIGGKNESLSTNCWKLLKTDWKKLIKMICRIGSSDAYIFCFGLTKKDSTFFIAAFKPVFRSYKPSVSGKVSNFAVINSVLIKLVFLWKSKLKDFYNCWKLCIQYCITKLTSNLQIIYQPYQHPIIITIRFFEKIKKEI